MLTGTLEQPKKNHSQSMSKTFNTLISRLALLLASLSLGTPISLEANMQDAHYVILLSQDYSWIGPPSVNSWGDIAVVALPAANSANRFPTNLLLVAVDSDKSLIINNRKLPRYSDLVIRTSEVVSPSPRISNRLKEPNPKVYVAAVHDLVAPSGFSVFQRQTYDIKAKTFVSDALARAQPADTNPPLQGRPFRFIGFDVGLDAMGKGYFYSQGLTSRIERFSASATTATAANMGLLVSPPILSKFTSYIDASALGNYVYIEVEAPVATPSETPTLYFANSDKPNSRRAIPLGGSPLVGGAPTVSDYGYVGYITSFGADTPNIRLWSSATGQSYPAYTTGQIPYQVDLNTKIAVNNFGRVAFIATNHLGKKALYSTNLGANREIIAVDDELSYREKEPYGPITSSKIADLEFGNGLMDNGDLVFSAGLENGKKVIVRTNRSYTQGQSTIVDVFQNENISENAAATPWRLTGYLLRQTGGGDANKNGANLADVGCNLTSEVNLLSYYGFRNITPASMEYSPSDNPSSYQSWLIQRYNDKVDDPNDPKTNFINIDYEYEKRFVRDANGDFVLDENNKKITELVKDGNGKPMFVLDAEGKRKEKNIDFSPRAINDFSLELASSGTQPGAAPIQYVGAPKTGGPGKALKLLVAQLRLGRPVKLHVPNGKGVDFGHFILAYALADPTLPDDRVGFDNILIADPANGGIITLDDYERKVITSGYLSANPNWLDKNRGPENAMKGRLRLYELKYKFLRAVRVSVFSPVNILVTAPDGRRFGVDGNQQLVDDGFNGTYFIDFPAYSIPEDGGPSLPIHDDVYPPKFLEIPNVQTGNYRVEIFGEGDGFYTVAVEIDISETQVFRTEYTGIATPGSYRTETVSTASATVTLGSLTHTFDGTPKAATVTTTPSGFPVVITYNGGATSPTNAGSYAVIATINSPTHTGSASGTLTINPAAAKVTLGGLNQAYDGTPRAATATTALANLPVTFTYNGSANAPTNAGSYAVAASVNSPNYTGSSNGTLTIARAAATVALGNLSQTFDGTSKSATITTTPAGLATTVTYDGSATAPTAVGSFAVVATIANANYTGSANGTLTITPSAPISATVTLGSSTHTYDGTPKAATATTTPPGLPVVITYNGSATAPTNAGSYGVVATINSPTHTGSASGTLTINPATATVTLADLNHLYDGTPRAATATTAPASLPVTFTYDGSANAPTNAGSYTVVASLNSPNYTGSSNGTLTIAPAAATVALKNLSQTFDGTPKSVTITTTPAGLATLVTYNGSATPPTAVGSFAVVATISNANYTGSTSGALTITPSAPISATVTLGSLTHTYDGTPRAATATTAPANLPVTFTYDGSANAPTNAGSYAVAASVNSPNYTGSSNGTLTIARAAATVAFGNLTQTFDGTPKSVTITTTPAGLATTATYDGSATAPTAVGSFAVVATIANANYTGSTGGTLTITPSAPINVSQGVKITPGGFRLNRATQGFAQVVTLQNISTQPISGPLTLILDGLSAHATLSSPAGITSVADPLGSPYVVVNIGADQVFSVGESVTVSLEFANPTNQPIAYVPRAVAGQGTR